MLMISQPSYLRYDILASLQHACVSDDLDLKLGVTPEDVNCHSSFQHN